MFALNMYSAFNGFNDYRTPDTNVMAALDNAGVGYSITSQGSIYAPGYGYAVADGSDFTAASTINNGSFYSDADTGATSAVLVIGNSAHNTLVDVPTFGDNAIVVNAQYAGPALKGGGELLKDIFAGMVGGEIDRWLHQDPNDPARIQVREHLRQAEVRVAGMFDPSRGVVEKSVPMRDATIASGFIQDHKFFVDMNGNGLPDIAFTQNPTTSQWYINYGDGWRPHDNPFTAPVF
jgi:hypothetical protein